MVRGNVNEESPILSVQIDEPSPDPREPEEGEVQDEMDKLLQTTTTGVPHGHTMRSAIITTMPIFMGYAGLIVLQRHIKVRMGIPDGQNEQSHVFGFGISMIYLGNLIFRLLHNIIFSPLVPRYRVCVSYGTMAVCHAAIAITYFATDFKAMWMLFLIYFLGGMSIGTFESNLLSCITPLGHATKSWAVLGIPLGFNVISVGAFALFSGVDTLAAQVSVYWFISASNLLGLVFFLVHIPRIEYEASKDTVGKFFQDLRKIREWSPLIVWNSLALMFDMFCVSMFSAIVFYIFDVPHLPILPGSVHTMKKNVFQTIYDLCSFLGDFTSRRIAYGMKRKINPMMFLVLSAVGAALALCKVTVLAPIGMFLVMFANGSIYATTTKHIDNVVPRSFNLVALSCWLFVGDAGSFTAAMIVQYVRGALGRVELPPSFANATMVPVSDMPITSMPHSSWQLW